MKTGCACIVSLSLLAPLSAQAVGVTLSALTPLSAQVTDGTSSNTATYPAGPLPTWGGLAAVLPPNIGVDVHWSFRSSSIGCDVNLEHVLLGANNVPGFVAHAGPHEFLLEFTATASVNAFLSIQRNDQLSIGTTSPSVRLDFDNDGVIDVANAQTGSPLVIARSFGPQSLFVRVIVDAAASGNGALVDSSLWLSLTPDNGLSITRVIDECRAFALPMAPFASPTFAGSGVEFVLASYASEIAVIVLGLSAQPSLLGAYAGVPCILLPTPEVIWFPPLNPWSIALPAAVRPVTFYAQGVTLTAAGLVVSDGYVIHAL